MFLLPDLAPTAADQAALADERGLHARLRRYAAAWLLGAAVVLSPAWPTAAHERSARPPAFERTLSWREFLKLRLTPWWLMQKADRSERDRPPAR
jgi:hypothetical protein